MAKAFKPQVMVSVPRSYYGDLAHDVKNGYIQKQFPTYSEVKKRMRYLLEVSDNNEVSVYRHRRGEWGEWYEKWVMINGKPKIFEEGWQ